MKKERNKNNDKLFPSGENADRQKGQKLKVCGMKYPDNILEIAALQPDYMGFIFYEKSSRFFNDKLPNLPGSIKKVGVFVNASAETIIKKLSDFPLQAIQLHGEESVEFCNLLKIKIAQTFPSKHIEIIKVFSVGEHFNFEQLKAFEHCCDYFLFDTKGALPGGNGYTFDWNLLQAYPSSKPYFLSGGIGLESMQALEDFKQNPISKYCYAIDVNSKFEKEPGLKNKEKLEQLKKML